MREQRVHHRGNRTDHRRPQQILVNQGIGRFIGTDERQQPVPEQQDNHPVEQRDRRTAPDAECSTLPRGIRILLSHPAGHQARASDSEQAGNTVQEEERRHGQRSSGNLGRIVQLADKECVCHVVQHMDQ